ncbi:hypothetical protein KI387_032760, partial [Taxus chinensis]
MDGSLDKGALIVEATTVVRILRVDVEEVVVIFVDGLVAKGEVVVVVDALT